MAAQTKESFEPLLHRLEDLERRVLQLEHRPDHHATVQAVMPETPLDAVSIGGVFGSVAKAVVGLAGAYFLRACAESGWFPRTAGIFAGFIYAISWLIAAGKTDPREQTTSTVYSLVSCIIFVGLMFQEAVRSAVLAASMSAVLIVVYFCAGQIVAWFNNRREIAAVTMASTTILSLVLFVATHNLVLFTVSLLCVAAASEFAACRGRWFGLRWIPAFGADFAIFNTAWIVNQSAGLPEGYAPFGRSSVLAIQLALVLIYLGSIGYRTIASPKVASAFEVGQNVVALGMFIFGTSHSRDRGQATSRCGHHLFRSRETQLRSFDPVCSQGSKTKLIDLRRFQPVVADHRDSRGAPATRSSFCVMRPRGRHGLVCRSEAGEPAVACAGLPFRRSMGFRV